MNEHRSDSALFQIDQDKVLYCNKNRVVNIKYNKNRQDRGKLEKASTPCYITFPQLTQLPYIKHGFSTKLGGVSRAHWSTMNLSFSRGDEREHVMTNFERISDAIGISSEGLVFTDQIHGTKIVRVTEADRGKGILKENDQKGVDGLITNVSGVSLVTFYADCVPLYFVDQRQRAIGLSHSGWRGTVKKMGLKTVEAMRQEFQSDPKDMIAVIGPSICRDCYEVSEDVAKEVREVFTKSQAKDLLEEKRNKKYQLDLWLANKYIMLEAGIPEENISISSICTCCNSTLLYSHRATNGKRGNLAAFLSII